MPKYYKPKTQYTEVKVEKKNPTLSQMIKAIEKEIPTVPFFSIEVLMDTLTSNSVTVRAWHDIRADKTNDSSRKRLLYYNDYNPDKT